jgi:nitroreductase
MILEAIVKRYSVRHYKDQPVEDDKLAEVLEAGRQAPSGCNIQPWKVVVVRDRATIRSLVHAIGGQQFVEQASVLIVACKNGEGYHIGNQHDGAIIDIAIALDHMTLQAASMDLGTCWLGNFDGDEVRALLGIPRENPVVAILALGYADESRPRKPRPRKPLDGLVCREKFKG